MFGENVDFLLENREQVIVIDDHSTEAEAEKGEKWCQKLGIQFCLNPGKGIPAAVDYVVNHYCDHNDWVLVMQQDVRFLERDAVSNLEKKLKIITDKDYKIGAIGFPNYVIGSHYHPELKDFNFVSWDQCWMGLFTLSSSAFYKTNKIFDYMYRFISTLPIVNRITKKFWHKVDFHRNFAPSTHPNYNDIILNYKGLSAVELPVWTAVAINCSAWKASIVPDHRFIFHLWFPDISNQFLNSNWYVCTCTDFIIINNWRIKFKYNQLGSVEEGKVKNGKMESYGGHLKVWKNKWGYDYSDPYAKIGSSQKIIKGSLLDELTRHNPRYPIKTFKI